MRLVDTLDEYGLPIVPVMCKPTVTEPPEFHRVMIDELKTRNDIETQWALQMIAKLQALWFEATDKLADIERIVNR